MAIADAVRSGKVRAREITEQFLDRVGRLDGPLGCYLKVDEAGARRRRADAVDAAVKDGRDPGPLAGVPLGHQGHLLHARASRPPAPRRSCAGSSPPTSRR